MDKDIYYATDKDLFDALASKKKVYTVSQLKDLCKKRNVFVSDKEEREDIIEYFSELPHSVWDLITIRDTMKANTKTEKTTSIKLEGNEIESNSVLEVLDELKDTRNKKYNENYNIISKDPNHIIVDIDYQEIDYGSTRLKQKQERTARIEIEKNSSGETSIRLPANEKANEIAEAFIKRINNDKDNTVKPKKINLSIVKNEKLRTKFFIELINNIPVLMIREVSSIHVNAFKNNEDNEEQMDESKQQVLAKLQTAIFKGENLLETQEYLDFEKKGFFITGITWQAVNKDTKEICLIEAVFHNEDECTDFAYNIKGIYQQNKDGTYQKTLKPLEGIKRTELSRQIEEKALQIADTIIEEFNIGATK